MYLKIFYVEGDFMKSDTIAAIATALSESGIGIIRVSGEEAISIVNKIFVSKKKDFSLVFKNR